MSANRKHPNLIERCLWCLDGAQVGRVPDLSISQSSRFCDVNSSQNTNNDFGHFPQPGSLLRSSNGNCGILRQTMNSEYPMDNQQSVLLSGLGFIYIFQIVDVSNVPIPFSLRQAQKVYVTGRVGLFAQCRLRRRSHTRGTKAQWSMATPQFSIVVFLNGIPTTPLVR